MEGIIRIEEYKIHCIMGSHAYEREIEQEISVNIELRVNLQECAQTDAIVDTIDCQKVVDVCRALAETRRYHLLETFAFEAVHALMDAFAPLAVKVRVKKRKLSPLPKPWKSRWC